MSNLSVRETFVNATEGYVYGDSEWYETWADSIGKLFKDCQKEYGRCVSSMYRDTDNGTVRVGWVFESKQRYEDTGEPYLRETWVEVSTVEPRKVWDYDPVPVSPWA